MSTSQIKNSGSLYLKKNIINNNCSFVSSVKREDQESKILDQHFREKIKLKKMEEKRIKNLELSEKPLKSVFPLISRIRSKIIIQANL